MKYNLLILLCSLVTVFSSKAQEPVAIEIKAIGGLQFDVVRFQVQPGAAVELTLVNADDMDHNLLITEIGKRESVVAAAFQLAEKGPEMQFIPNSKEVMYSIDVVSPGEKKVLNFTAPSQPGVYPYVCTYPGHGTVMYGAMYVMEKEMPSLAEDVNIPQHRRGKGGASPEHDHHGMHLDHPYESIPPYMYRIYMPNTGPASIAVRISDDLSYCWDAGRCMLRYIWSGDFVDISEPWSIKGDALAKVLGDVFHVEEKGFPFQIGSGKSEVDYKGYQLVEGDYPEFMYTVDGYLVYELIIPGSDKNELIRRFRIPSLDQPLQLVNSSTKTSKVEVDKGVVKNKTFTLSATEGHEFEMKIISLKN